MEKPVQPRSAGTALFWRLESCARIYTLQIVRLSSTTNSIVLSLLLENTAMHTRRASTNWELLNLASLHYNCLTFKYI